MASRKSKSEAEREKVIQNRLQELLTRMLQDEDNKYCVDCDAKGIYFISLCVFFDYYLSYNIVEYIFGTYLCGNS